MKTTPALSQQEKAACLRAGGLCRMPGEVVERVAAACSTRHLLRGEQIHRRGALPDGMSWVLSGSVRICRSSPNGREVTIGTVGGGGTFGVMSALDGFPFSADACAESDTVLVFLSRLNLLELLEEFPRLYAPLMAIMCDKLRHALMVVENLACLRLEARLARRLLSLAPPADAASQGDCAVALIASQDELSQMLGASRQAINKHLQGWQMRGLIKIERRRLLINDRRALERIV